LADGIDNSYSTKIRANESEMPRQPCHTLKHPPELLRVKTFFRTLLAGIFGLLLSSQLLLAADGKRPNIIVIYTDDQGFGDASCLNPNAKFQTPNLDRLAKEGVSFTNGHSSDSVCTPSRYGLLTGRYCWRTVKKAGVLGAEAPCLIADDRMTLASLLRDSGYNTAMVGKWHLGMDFPGDAGSRDWSQPVQDMPLDKGFDYFYGIPASLNYGILAWFEGRHARVPPTLFTNKKKNDRAPDYRIKPPYQNTPAETKKLLGKQGMEIASDFIDNQCLTRFTDKAIEWMQSKSNAAKAGKPFFVYLPYTSPHYPVCPLPKFHGQGQCGAYGEFVIETDYHIGRILKFLEESGLDENTMIVFSSDNGPENAWRKRIPEFGHDSSQIYRGGKRDIYEGGHRVPFFVRWPGGIKQPGRSWNKIVGQVDLLATLADVVGTPIPENAGEDSQSFARVLTNPRADYQREPLINHSARGQFSITHGNWKLVLPRAKAKMELYDLATDPAEEKNLVANHPEQVTRLKKKATDIVLNGRTTPGAVQANDTGYWSDLKWMTEAEYDARQESNDRD
jgi:arylsulfatase A